MQEQLFRDPATAPTREAITAALGAAGGVYPHFLEEAERHAIVLDWRYYKDGKAWLCKGLYRWTTTRGTPKETMAFWLAVWEGFLRLTIYVPEKHREAALNLPLSAEMKLTVAEAKQMGKLKFFPLTFDLRDDAAFGDLFTLIDFRKLLK